MNQRFYSLDVFRGATVAFMILVNNPGSWKYSFAPLQHASWHGCTPTDLVFPFFLFAVGNAMAFVMPKFRAAGDSFFWKKVIQRSFLIFAIGLFLNWSPFIRWEGDNLGFKQWENIRIMGVLQRIALCYFFASIIVFYFKQKGAFAFGVLLLLLYWVICLLLGNEADPYSLTGWFGSAWDKAILGVTHMYKSDPIPFDPEGFMSSFPAISQVIFGFLVGTYIQIKGKNFEMLSSLFVAAVVVTFTGFCWDMAFPINKKIWTSSYVLYTTGLAMFTIATLMYFNEFKNVRGWWTRFFDVFGKNPLFIFALSSFLPRALALVRIPNGITNDGTSNYLSPFSWYYEKIGKLIPGAIENGSLFYSLSMVVMYWVIGAWLDKRKIYFKV